MIGNETLEELIETVKPYRFDDAKGDSILRRKLRLRHRILKEGINGKTVRRISKALCDKRVQFLLSTSLPTPYDLKYTNFTSDLEIDGKGKVYGLELTELGCCDSFKYWMAAGLFVLNLLDGVRPTSERATVLGCGIPRSLEATASLVDLLGLRGCYFSTSSMYKVNSRFVSPEFEIHTEELGILENIEETKNAAYITMIREFERNPLKYIYQAHSELGWVVMLPVAQAYKKLFDAEGIERDILLSCIGAGTFFVPFALRDFAKANYLGEYREHHPMTSKLPSYTIEDIPSLPFVDIDGYDYEAHLRARENLTRKFKANPFIPKRFWEKISQRVFGGSLMGYKMLGNLMEARNSVGITTAELLGGASHIAQETNKTIVVPIFERELVDYSV
jgi:hypothetical protein